MATLTAKDIAERIQRPGEPLSAAVNRLRNWTATGIIKAEGEKHPGTGHKRLYSASALLHAMLLQTLTDTYGSPAAALVSSLVVLAGMVARATPRSRRGEPPAIVISGPIASGLSGMSVVPMKRIAKHISKSKHDVHTVIDLRRFFDRLPPDTFDDFEAAMLAEMKKFKEKKGTQ